MSFVRHKTFWSPLAYSHLVIKLSVLVVDDDAVPVARRIDDALTLLELVEPRVQVDKIDRRQQHQQHGRRCQQLGQARRPCTASRRLHRHVNIIRLNHVAVLLRRHRARFTTRWNCLQKILPRCDFSVLPAEHLANAASPTCSGGFERASTFIVASRPQPCPGKPRY